MFDHLLSLQGCSSILFVNFNSRSQKKQYLCGKKYRSKPKQLAQTCVSAPSARFFSNYEVWGSLPCRYHLYKDVLIQGVRESEILKLKTSAKVHCACVKKVFS